MKIPIIVVAALFIISCDGLNGTRVTGNGNIRTEKRNTGNFNAVRTSGSIDIEINSGDAYNVSVEDDDNILQYVVTEVNNGALNIHYSDDVSVNDDHAKVYVTVPSLNKIISSGSADISITDVLKNTDKIELKVSGSGTINGELDAPAVSVEVSGSGNVDLRGRTKDFDCSVSGSGDVKCANLQSENATVHVSGSGNAHVFASVHLSASAAGSGDVYYSGSPANPEIHTSGSGSVQAER